MNNCKNYIASVLTINQKLVMADKTNVPGFEDDYSYSGTSSHHEPNNPNFRTSGSKGNETVISGLESDETSLLVMR